MKRLARPAMLISSYTNFTKHGANIDLFAVVSPVIFAEPLHGGSFPQMDELTNGKLKER